MKNLTIVFVFFFVNCTDNKVKPLEPGNYKDAIQLAVGNKWVYEVKTTNNNTEEINQLENENITILDSQKCNNAKAFILTSSKNYFFERTVIDSAGNLIDCYKRDIIFSGVQLEDTLYEDSNMLIRMTEADKKITVPVGSFDVVNYQTVFKESGEVWNHYYANGIGLIKQVYEKPNEITEHNLIEYTLN